MLNNLLGLPDDFDFFVLLIPKPSSQPSFCSGRENVHTKGGMKTSHNYSRTAAAKLFGLSRPTLVRLDEVKPELAPTTINQTTVAYSLEQLAEISRLYRKEPDLKVAEELGIPEYILFDFFWELPAPQNPTPSSSDFSESSNRALANCELLRLVADGIYSEVPTILKRILRRGFSDHKSKMLIIAAILADIDSSI